jgi:hypothetical protein
MTGIAAKTALSSGNLRGAKVASSGQQASSQKPNLPTFSREATFDKEAESL